MRSLPAAEERSVSTRCGPLGDCYETLRPHAVDHPPNLRADDSEAKVCKPRKSVIRTHGIRSCSRARVVANILSSATNPQPLKNRPIACCRSISQKAFRVRYILRRKMEPGLFHA